MTAAAQHQPFDMEGRVRSLTVTRDPSRRAWTPTAPGPPPLAPVGPHVGPHIRKEWMAYDRFEDVTRRGRPQ
jgi:hypothetical protein